MVSQEAAAKQRFTHTPKQRSGEWFQCPVFPVLVAGLPPAVYDLLAADLTANLALRDSLPSSPGFDG